MEALESCHLSWGLVGFQQATSGERRGSPSLLQPHPRVPWTAGGALVAPRCAHVLSPVSLSPSVSFLSLLLPKNLLSLSLPSCCHSLLRVPSTPRAGACEEPGLWGGPEGWQWGGRLLPGCPGRAGQGSRQNRGCTARRGSWKGRWGSCRHHRGSLRKPEGAGGRRKRGHIKGPGRGRSGEATGRAGVEVGGGPSLALLLSPARAGHRHEGPPAEMIVLAPAWTPTVSIWGAGREGIPQGWLGGWVGGEAGEGVAKANARWGHPGSCWDRGARSRDGVGDPG